jgi:hypothetical protein
MISDDQRKDMILEAFSGFLENPIFGNGTWNFAYSYQDPYKLVDEIAVHSVVLQLIYEYGIIGVLVSVLFFWAFVWSLSGFIKFYPYYIERMGARYPWVIGFIIISFGAGLFLNTFNGLNRIQYGLALGFCIWIISSNKKLSNA